MNSGASWRVQMDTIVLLENDMLNTNGENRFGALAREVFSWDAAIRWIALDDRGRQQLEWRDPHTEVAAAATTPRHPLTVDPLLLMLAESRHDIYNSGDRADPQHLRFVVLAYRDHAQIVTKFGRYGQLSIGIGLAGNAYQVGTRLAGLLDNAEDSRVDAHANVSERQREKLRVCSPR
jgi:hypothetical protein